MSHFKERTEKDCLNCRAEVSGRFCQVCGQENIEPKENAWHLITHFFYDITHFDGKFFSTVKYLLLRPGFLAYEYTRGRRMSYLHPIRMYVFTSAFFFLLYFSFFSESEGQSLNKLKTERDTVQKELVNLGEMARSTSDTVIQQAIKKSIAKHNKTLRQLNAELDKKTAESANREKDANNEVDKIVAATKDTTAPVSDTLAAMLKQKDSVLAKKVVVDEDFLEYDFYTDAGTYLAIQEELPAERRDAMPERLLKKQLLGLKSQEGENKDKAMQGLQERIVHAFPKILFISLPVFAFLLKLLYFRRKKYYYADHGIFTIHAYCAIFVMLLLYYLLGKINDKWDWWGFTLMEALVFIYMLYYVYKAMRIYYRQGRLKTFIKYFILAGMTAIVMGILVFVFSFFIYFMY